MARFSSGWTFGSKQRQFNIKVFTKRTMYGEYDVQACVLGRGAEAVLTGRAKVYRKQKCGLVYGVKDHRDAVAQAVEKLGRELRRRK